MKRSNASWANFLLKVLPTVVFAWQCFAQGPGSSASSKQLSPIVQRDLLRQPNGLEACAKRVGHYVLRSDVCVFARATLKTLTDASPIIFIGHVAASKSSLIDEGDYIATDYKIAPEVFLRGRINGNFTLRVRGGSVTFPDGTSAQVVTSETETMKVGGRYCLFLTNGPDSEKRLTNAEEAIFSLSSAGVVESAAAKSFGVHAIADEVKGMTSDSFVSKVQALVASAPF